MQRVLDIDLDFFLDRIFNCDDEPHGRLDSRTFKVDTVETALNYLREHCLVSTDAPRPGRVCERHAEVYFHWNRMIRSGELKIPFEVIHVDAHADMGLGNTSCLYIAEDLLAEPPSRRRAPTGRDSWCVGDNNFIAYALACRWIGRLTYVTHPDCKGDLQWMHMKDFDTRSGYVQMKRFKPGFTERLEHFLDLKKLPFEAEPDIPIQTVSRMEHRSESPPDFVFIARSPNYTPKTADALFEQLKRLVSAA